MVGDRCLREHMEFEVITEWVKLAIILTTRQFLWRRSHIMDTCNFVAIGYFIVASGMCGKGRKQDSDLEGKVVDA
jgi:hypothetical protein